MGIMRKAAIGSLLVGLGTVAMAQNKKAGKKVTKMRKSATKEVKRMVRKGRRLVDAGAARLNKRKSGSS